MAFLEDLVKLRSKLAEAVRLGVVDEGNFRDMYQATLVQILNESERKRQEAQSSCEDLRKKLTHMEGQERAFGQVSYLLFQIIDGYIAAALKAAREEAEQEHEMAEKRRLAAEAQAAAEGTPVEPQVEPPVETTKPKRRPPKA